MTDREQTFEVFLCSHHGPLTEARLPQCPYCYDALVERYVTGRERIKGSDQTLGESDDTQGVIWEKPDGRGGWIAEASCWVEGCHVRIEGYDREEVERLMADHQGAFHGN